MKGGLQIMGRKFKGFLIVLAILSVLTLLIPSNNVASAIGDDDYFKYSTSINNRYDSTDDADIYVSDEGVIQTAMHIIAAETPISHSDLANPESIVITYDDYYVLVYKGEDDVTYVQVSSRTYVQENGFDGLYRPYHRNTVIFFDTSYRKHWYSVDRNRYGNRGYYDTKSNTVKPSKTTTYEPKSTKIKTEPKESTKIKTDPKASTKIKTDPKASTKIKTTAPSSSGSVRSGSTGSRTSIGGGTSFGK